MRIRLDLAYDGTDFAGWQNQPGRETVQGAVEEALRRLYRLDRGTRRPLVGAGRTDAGVHAEGQVAHFDAPRRIPEDGILAGLNHLLPRSVRVMAVQSVGPEFHARRSASGKTYRYFLLPGAPGSPDWPPSPLALRYAWAVGRPLRRAPMEESAAALVGEHDFRAFFTAPPGEQPKSPRRTITAARWFDRDDFWIFEVTGSGFLRYMVRRMVGSLVAAGLGRIGPEAVEAMLRDPTAGGPRLRAPARGLRLHRVEYPDSGGDGSRRGWRVSLATGC